MNSISNPLQLRADRPLEPERYATLSALDGILKSLQCPYMLVGATASDILLYSVFGQRIFRATQDVDIGISIDSWERFDTVKSAILRAPDFQPSTAQPYRVLHKTHGAACATPIDILPFGEIATEMEAFRWPPPDTDLVMLTSLGHDSTPLLKHFSTARRPGVWPMSSCMIGHRVGQCDGLQSTRHVGSDNSVFPPCQGLKFRQNHLWHL